LEGKSKFWPADLHILGKEILWFHAVIWQAMLLSAGIELPKRIYVHSFYMIDGQKMSKSLGNVIAPQQLIDLFGVDGARYLVARSFPTENDSDVGIARFKERYNADLANNLGNLVSRVSKLAEGLDPPTASQSWQASKEDFVGLMDNLKFDEALTMIFEKYIDRANVSLNKECPWKLDGKDEKRINCLREAINCLQEAAKLLRPFIPETAEKIEKCFEGKIKPLDQPLFPRIK
jgi:methionyl-tRNA synthetase